MLSHHRNRAVAGNAGGGGFPYTPALFDPVNTGTGITLSNGNRTAYRVPPGASWKTAYLDMQLSSGIWAIEWVWSAGTSMDGANYPILGYGDTLLPDSVMSSGSRYHEGCDVALGYSITNGYAVKTGWFSDARNNTSPVFSPGDSRVAVFDFDTQLFYMLNDAETELIQCFGIGNVLTNFYFGFAMYSSVGQGITINTGQEPFNETNEAFVAALEVTLGKSINRGFGS